VTADDIAVADSEIFAEEAAAPVALPAGDAIAPPPAPPVRTRASRTGSLRRRGIGWIEHMLSFMDRPFSHWSAERKALVGYVAIATVVMALVAWTLGISVAR
jgi:hypothetical protein